MDRKVNVKELQARLARHAEIALLDTREQGVHYRGHPFFASSAPLSKLEMMIARMGSCNAPGGAVIPDPLQFE